MAIKKDNIVETLWEIQHEDLFAEAFTTNKGTFVNIRYRKGTVTLPLEDALMILQTAKNYGKGQ